MYPADRAVMLVSPTGQVTGNAWINRGIEANIKRI